MATELKSRGCVISFVCRNHPGNLNDLIRKNGFEVLDLSQPTQENRKILEKDSSRGEYAQWLGVTQVQDARETLSVLGEKKPDWLIVDHYVLDKSWETALRPNVKKVMVIDDLADREHDCDLLLDQNLVANRNTRYQDLLPTQCGRLLGPEFALLQSQYSEFCPCVPPREGRVRRVLVYFGGADTDNLTGRTIAAFLSLGRSDISLDVVINPSSLHAATIRWQISVQKQIALHEELPSLAPLMVKADLAIGAGGATSWERCCLGLPSLVVTLAENQIPIAEELHHQGCIRWLGHKDKVSEADIAKNLKSVIEADLQPDWSANCRQKVDGFGTKRVADILLLNAQTKLQARPVRLEDEALILKWANDPFARQNAFSSEAIALSTHRTWFRSKLRDFENNRFFIVETEDEFPIGQVRFERVNDEWEIDYSLEQCVRGRKLGRKLLQTAMVAFRESTNGVILLAQVKKSNTASCHIFEELGFESGFESGNGGGEEVVCRYSLRPGKLDQPFSPRFDINLAEERIPGWMGPQPQ